MTEKLFDVTAVKFQLGKSLPPFLTVEAEGTGSSSGWTDVHLSPYVYITPPEDGIQEFDLVGDKPDGGLTVMTHYNATYADNCEDWVVGVRVHAATNSMEGTER